MKEIWSYKFEGRGIRSRKPALCGDRLLTDFYALRGDMFDSHLVCLDASTGKENWRRKDGSLFNDPIIDESNIIYASSFSGVVHAFNRAGKRPGSQKAHDKTWGCPALQGKSELPLRNSGRGRAPGALTGLVDRCSGAIRAVITPSRSASDGQIIVQSTGTVIHCLSAVTGTLLWKQENNIWFFKSCILDDVVLFLAEGAACGRMH